MGTFDEKINRVASEKLGFGIDISGDGNIIVLSPKFGGIDELVSVFKYKN